jgi:Uma2 family endonuclease
VNITLLKTWTVTEYLDWADTQSERRRTELINGQIVPMSPEQADHNRVKLSICMALVQAVKAARLPCEVFTDGMTVPIDRHTAYEPDALVHCGPRIPSRQLTVPAPTVVVEVLSPTSAHSDTSAKLIGYFKIASIRHYLVIDPDARSIVHHMRLDDGTLSANTLRAGNLRLDPPGIVIKLADVFE